MAKALSQAQLRRLRQKKKDADTIRDWLDACELPESALEGRSMDQILDIWNEDKDENK